MDNITLAILINTIANALSCAAIFGGGYLLGQRRDNATARYLSQMLYGIGTEIIFATVALYFLDNLWVWIGLRLTGRGVEFVGVARFLRYLSQAEPVKPPAGDAGP